MAEQDVPPLEDMSDLIHQVETLRDNRTHPNYRHHPSHINISRNITSYSNDRSVPNSSIEQPSYPTSPSQLGATGYTPPSNLSNSQQCNNICNNVSSGAKPKNTFAGFKTGFLINKTSDASKNDKRVNEIKNLTESNVYSSKKTYNKDMPFIKAKPVNPLEIPEVTESMAASNLLLQNKDSWLTDDLLSKIKNDTFLHRCLSNPEYVQAITEMQRDPQMVAQRYQNNPEMQRFLREFMSTLGDHFTSLAGKEIKSQNTDIAASKPKSNVDINLNCSKKISSSEDSDAHKMQKILEDPEIMQILKDSRIQKLFEVLRSEPDRCRRMIDTADVDMRQKIQKLIDVGLLAIQMH